MVDLATMFQARRRSEYVRGKVASACTLAEHDGFPNHTRETATLGEHLLPTVSVVMID